MLAQILVIEDSDLQRALYCNLLASDDHAILKAGSITEAREIIRYNRVHVVVLDVNLPDGSGLEFIYELKKTLPLAEIIVFTARSLIKNDELYINSGAFGHLVKGDPPVKLISLVAEARNLACGKLSLSPDENNFSL